MISSRLVAKISEDIQCINEIEEHELNILLEFLLSHEIVNTDLILKDIADIDGIDGIKSNMASIFPFLYNYGVFLARNKNDIDGIELLENLKPINEKTKNFMAQVFANTSNFFKSIELENQLDSFTDTIDELGFTSSAVKLKYNYFGLSSRISFKQKGENIVVVMDKKQLNLLSEKIKEAIIDMEDLETEMKKNQLKIIN